ncbi:hypothetical protein MW887_010384 [Aspergillus wentii]|nr:hypothetical protein MW887_010384 [Aspergillus wentii]
MPTITFSSFVTVPFLALLSVPLLLTAYITICFSVLALFIRLSIIYIELSYAIITNYFVIPTSSNSSLLTFAASEPTTPFRRRSSDHGSIVNHNTNTSSHTLPRTPSARQLRLLVPPGPGPGIITNAKPRPALRRYNSSNSDGQGHRKLHKRTRDARNNSNPCMIPSSATTASFLSLVSGDEGRDFEGVGGWRCPAPASSSKSRSGHPSRSASLSPTSPSSPSPSDHAINDEEADERAWLSINNRLELPSQPAQQQVQQQQQQQRGRRHHQRSITTSM